MRTKTTMITKKKLGRRRPKRMPYEELIRRDEIYRVLKNNHQELGRKGQSNSQNKQQSGEKDALEKEHHNYEKELGKKVLKSQRKSHKR